MRNLFVTFAIIICSFATYAQTSKSESLARPKTFSDFNNLGVKTVLESGDNKRALKYFEKALEMKPGCFVCLVNKGRAFVRLERYEEAIAIFEEALKTVPGSAEVYSSLGEAKLNQGKTEESISYFKKAVNLGLEDSMTLTNLGIALTESGKPREALRYLDRSIKVDSNIAETHSNRGIALFRLGKKRKALEAFQTADRLRPNNKQIANNLGVVYDVLGKRQLARKYYQKALEIDSGFALAQYNLASNFLEGGNRTEAYKRLNLLKNMNSNLANDLQGMLWGRFVVDASRRRIR